MITTLTYRVWREGKEIFRGNFPDEGQHNVSLCDELVSQHHLKPEDIIILDLKFKSTLLPVAYRITKSRGVEAAHLPQGA